ncbi:MAG: hypothetical protein ACI4XC_07110 [Eubacterium sp.]
MKQCETCGKKLSTFDVWETNNKIQCKECADKEFKEKYNNSHKKDTNVNTVENSVSSNDTKKESHVNITNGWASGMKILTIILLIVLLVASIIIAFLIGDESDSFLLGLGAYIGLTVASFAVVGFSMSFLQLAEDVSYLKNFIRQEYEDK